MSAAVLSKPTKQKLKVEPSPIDESDVQFLEDAFVIVELLLDILPPTSDSSVVQPDAADVAQCIELATYLLGHGVDNLINTDINESQIYWTKALLSSLSTAADRTSWMWGEGFMPHSCRRVLLVVAGELNTAYTKAIENIRAKEA